MESWDSSAWWGLAIVLFVLLALPLMARQGTDLLMEKKHPHVPNQDEEAKTERLGWLWVAGLVVLLLLWRMFGD